MLAFLLAFVVVAYSLLYFNNTYPISEGWGVNYVELIFHGKVPYRDFYYFLPPLNLLVDAVFWKLSFGSLLVFRGWYLLQRVIIYILIFRLLCKFFDSYHTFLACALTVIIGTGDVYDLFGDYNQTMLLLAVLLSYGAVDFACAETTRKKLLYLSLSGVVLGLEFLNKQTIFVACCLVFFAALTILCILKKDKCYWRYCLAVAVGMALPLAVSFVWLAVNGALVPFFEQVFFNVDNKGSLLHILIGSVTSRLWVPQIWVVIILILVLLKLENVSAGHNRKGTAFAAGSLLCGLVIFGIYESEISLLGQIVIRYRSAIAAVLFCVILFAASLYGTRRERDILSQEDIVRLETLGVSMCALVMMGINFYSPDFAKELHSNRAWFVMIQDLVCYFIFIGSIVLFILLLFKYQTSSDDKEKRRTEMLLFINCGGFSTQYAAIMASGDLSFPTHSIRIILPFILCAVLSVKMQHPIISRVFKGGILTGCIVFSMACVSQKITCSYEWWGSYMAPMEEKVYSVDIPAMAGIRVSADQKELYETVTKVIEENTDEDAVIWGYPHIKLFNVLTGRYNMDTFVPVLFYDVVADVYVEQEAKLLAQNLPDVVIWENIEGCIEANELAFRDGKPLKQREIERFFAEVLPEKYKLNAQIGDVSVYILNESESE